MILNRDVRTLKKLSVTTIGVDAEVVIEMIEEFLESRPGFPVLNLI